MSQFKQLFDRLAQMTKATTTGITTGTGVVNYNLEPVAKTLYPVITPLRNSIPRVVDENGGTGINWKAITAINPGNTPSTMKEGRRSGYIDQTEADYSVNFATIGLENYITEQAIMAAKGFDNALAIAGDNLLRSTMIAEEMLDLGGNQTKAFGTQAAPTGTLVAGGTMTAQATICKVVSLTLDGYNRALSTGAVVQTITRSNGDGTSDVINGGSSIVSAASAGVTTAGGNLSITWKTTAKPGAFGYAWFTGTTSGSLVFAGVTSINVFTQTANAGGTQTDGSLTATDYSANPLAYDGLVTIAAAGGGAYMSLDGATLTADGVGGVVEIDAFLAAFYIARKVTPTKIWANPQERNNITRKVLGGPGGTGATRITTESGNGAFKAGMVIASYLNKSSVGAAQDIPIMLHPNIPPGKLFFDCDDIPYPLANIPGCRVKKLRRDWWQVLWPQVTMNRQTGVYYDGAIQCYTPFAMGVMDNIGNG